MGAQVNELIIKYRSDITELQSKVATLETTMKKVDAAASNTSEHIQSGFKKSAQSVGALDGEVNRVEARMRVLGERIIALFAIERVAEFGLECVRAFENAEKAGNNLKFVITNISKEGIDKFRELVEQSETLSKSLNALYTPVQIQGLQARLAIVKLSASQIAELIPRIADIAAKTGRSLDEVGEAFVKALGEGQTRGLVDLGLKFESTGDRVADFNLLMSKSASFIGGAKDAMNDLANVEQEQNNQLELLKERIGKEIAPTFLELKGLLIDVGGDFANLGGSIADLFSTPAGFDDFVAKLSNVLTLGGGNFLTAAKIKNIEMIQFLKDVKDANDQNLQLLKEGLTEQQNVAGISVEQFNELTDELDAINREQVKRTEATERAKTKASTNSIEDISSNVKKFNDDQLKAIGDAAKAQSAVEVKFKGETIANLSTLNVKGFEKVQEIINKEIQFRAEALKKIEAEQDAASKRLAELKIESENKAAVAKVETDPEKKLDAEYDAALKNAERIFAASKKSATDIANLKAIEAAIEIEFENKISDAVIKKREETAKKLAELNKKNAEQDLANNVASVSLGSEIAITKLLEDFQKRGDFSKRAFAQFETDKKNILLGGENATNDLLLQVGDDADKKRFDHLIKAEKDKQRLLEDAARQEVELEKQTRELKNQLLTDSLSAAQQIFKDSIDEQFQEQLQARQDSGDLQLKTIEDQIQANNDLRSKDMIGLRDYTATNKKLLEEKTAAEKKQKDDLAKIKTQQAQADKLLALLNIAVNTAEAVAKISVVVAEITAAAALNPFLIPSIAIAASQIPIAIALGAVQAGVVLAQPIPKFARGTKGAGGAMSLVGEEGPEIMFVPQHAKILPANTTARHAAMIDAMYDNQLQEHLNKFYINPALQRQQVRFEQHQQQSFATNIANSFLLNSSGLTANEMDWIRRKGTTIRNAEQLGDIIANKILEALPTNSRRYN